MYLVPILSFMTNDVLNQEEKYKTKIKFWNYMLIFGKILLDIELQHHAVYFYLKQHIC